MRVIIFIDSEDIAIAINTFLTINNIDSKIFYKNDIIDFKNFNLIIISEDRVPDFKVQNISIKKIILTHSCLLANVDGYLLRPFTSSELMKMIKEI